MSACGPAGQEQMKECWGELEIQLSSGLVVNRHSQRGTSGLRETLAVKISYYVMQQLKDITRTGIRYGVFSVEFLPFRKSSSARNPMELSHNHTLPSGSTSLRSASLSTVRHKTDKSAFQHRPCLSITSPSEGTCGR